MKFVVVSHKEAWRRESGYATTGGFPQQMWALSQLFESTEIVLPIFDRAAPGNLLPLDGHNVAVVPLHAPHLHGGLRRKLTLAANLPRNWPRIWRAVRRADAVHAPVPGDIGTLGIVAALLQRKPLFVRYCTEWRQPQTAAAVLLRWLLVRVAGGRNVVLATGGAATAPVAANRHIDWIFATTLGEAAWRALPQATAWQPPQQLRLITVGRLEAVKNLDAAIDALALLDGLDARLDVIGHGSRRDAWQQLARDRGVAERVVFHGNLPHDEVIDRLAASHLFLMPSQIEGFPKAALEAMACGLPVVASAVSVLPRLVGDSGVLLPQPTAAAIAAALQQLTADWRQLPQLGRRARQHSKAYTLEAWQAAIREHLERAWRAQLGGEQTTVRAQTG